MPKADEISLEEALMKFQPTGPGWESGKMVDLDKWRKSSKENVVILEGVMRNSVEILRGPNDPLTEIIAAYMRGYKAQIEMGRKVKRSEFSEEDIITAVAPPTRRQLLRRF